MRFSKIVRFAFFPRGTVYGAILMALTILVVAPQGAYADQFSACAQSGSDGAPCLAGSTPQSVIYNTGLVPIPGGLGSVSDQGFGGMGIADSGATVSISLPLGYPQSTASSGQVAGGFVLDNIVISGPASMIGVVIPVSLNITMSASFSGTANGPSLVAGGNGGVSVVLPGLGDQSLGTVQFGGGSSTVTGPWIFSVLPSGTSTATAVASSPVFFVAVGDTISVGVETGVADQAGEGFGGGPGLASASLEVDASLGSTSGPVFNLPTGVTANTPDGLIFNNHFTGATPEPSTLLLLGSGLLAAGGTLRRKHAARTAIPTRS